jgi:CheY-like chemotaxis protein
MMHGRLSGKRVLVLEDEALIAAMVEDMLTDLGIVVVGPVSSIERGLLLARSEELDAALLDLNIRSARAYPVADILQERGIPYVFATGYGQSGVDRSNPVAVLEKPYTQDKLADALLHALNSHTDQSR